MYRLVKSLLYIGPATVAVGLAAILVSVPTQSNAMLQIGGVLVALAVPVLVRGFLGYVLLDDVPE